MNRRRVLAGATTFAAASLTGCVSNGGADPRGPGGGTDGDPTATDRPPEFASASLEPTGSGCGGQQRDAATVAFEDDPTRVVVTGTIWGSDACKVPVLAGADYDAGTDELTVTVAATDREDGGAMCAQCIVELEYRATCAFDHGLPASVRVVHERGSTERVVTTANRE